MTRILVRLRFDMYKIFEKPWVAIPLAFAFVFIFFTILITSRRVLTSLPSTPTTSIPRLAYLVSGSKGDVEKLWRLLLALYHPRNYYVLHLDREAPTEESKEMVRRIEAEEVIAKVGNVEMITPGNMVTYRGPTMVSTTLHACALLLRKRKDWDWFINLSASDYPLMTQDDILHGFSSLSRNLNFVDHTSNLGWKAPQRAKPLIIDPGLYKSNKTDIFWMTETRELSTAFKLFTGSAWTALSRHFVEHCVWGWDDLPRTLLMYYTNFVSSPECYFQTLLCNTPEFTTTVVNHDLHHIQWDVPPRQHPRILTVGDIDGMVASDAPFARKFSKDDLVLDEIDSQLLHRPKGEFTPGGWCGGSPPSRCSEVKDVVELELPGHGARRFHRLMDNIVRSKSFAKKQCR